MRNGRYSAYTKSGTNISNTAKIKGPLRDPSKTRINKEMAKILLEFGPVRNKKHEDGVNNQ